MEWDAVAGGTQDYPEDGDDDDEDVKVLAQGNTTKSFQ